MVVPQPPFTDPKVQAAFQAFPDTERQNLLRIRSMIFDIAGDTVGPITETLKWGQPAYLPVAPRTGTAVRLATSKCGSYAVLVHCQTTLIRDLQAVFANELRYDGNRGVVFDPGEPPNEAALRMLIHSALTYHKR